MCHFIEKLLFAVLVIAIASLVVALPFIAKNEQQAAEACNKRGGILVSGGFRPFACAQPVISEE